MKTSSGIFGGQIPIETLTFKQQAYKAIKDAIIYQKLEPEVVYSQETICSELGISRTPVREALLELQKEGYIHFCRGKGLKIPAVDTESIHEILEIRVFQEQIAAMLAAKRASEEEIGRIFEAVEAGQKNMHSQDYALCYRMDHQFHRAIAAASHNSILYDEIDTVLDRYLRFEVLSVYKSRVYAADIWQEHQKIADAIREHDPEKARRAADRHLQEAYRRTLGKYWDE